MRTRLLIAASLCAVTWIGLAVAQEGPRPLGGRRQARSPSQGQAPPPRIHPASPLLVALDGDRDGGISATEIANAAAALATLDANQDGQLTRDELRPTRPAGPEATGNTEGADQGVHRPGDGLLRRDTDGDGLVSLEEFTTPLKQAFATLDANGDGSIDATEAQAAPPPAMPRHRRPGSAGDADGQGRPPGAPHGPRHHRQSPQSGI